MSLKKVIKESAFLSAVAYGGRKLYYKSLQRHYRSAPLNRKKVLFSNFNGRGYGCNPKAIAEKLHALRPDYELVWVCSSKAAEESLPPYVRPVSYNTRAYFKDLVTAGTWVFNLTAQDYITKREGQFYIQTWHGDRAFKKILHDAEELDSFKKWMRNVKLREDELCDCCMSASDFGTRIYRSSFLYHGRVTEFGQPRNDVLVHMDPDRAAQVRKRLKLSGDLKLLLYAPTFRDHLKSEKKSNSNIQLDRVVEELERLTGSKWMVLLRAHSGKELSLSGKGMLDNSLDVTAYPDMADLLLIADLLITDYSSCAPDFALTGRPILLYQDDIEEYVSKDRTMWFTMEESPYWYANNMEELLTALRKITPEAAQENDRAILDFYGTKESGESSRIICEEIIRRAGV